MKKIILVCSLFLGLISCKNNNSETPLDKIDSVSKVEIEKPILHEFKTKTEELCFKLKENEAKVIEKIKSETPEKANQSYEDFRIKTDTIIAKLNSENENLLLEYNVLDKTKFQKKYNEVYESIISAKLEIANIAEGFGEFQSKPNYFSELFKNKVTTDYQDFLNLEAVDETILYSADAGLGISFEDLSKRVLNWENWLVKYPNSRLYKKSKDFYRIYITDYLLGMDNSPVFDSETKSILEENKREFNRFLKVNPKAISSKMINLLFKNLDKYDENGTEKLYALIQKEIDKHFKSSK